MSNESLHTAKNDNIPCDFDGLMGVPLTILEGFDYDMFDLIRIRYGYDGKDLTLPNGKQPFTRVIIKRRK